MSGSSEPFGTLASRDLILLVSKGTGTQVANTQTHTQKKNKNKYFLKDEITWAG